jgi:hypothetical protein
MLVAENPHDIQRLIQIPRWRRAGATSSLDKGKQSEMRDGTAAAAAATSNTASSQDNGDDRALEDAAANKDHQDNTNNEDNEAEYDSVDRDVWLYEHLRWAFRLHPVRLNLPNMTFLAYSFATILHNPLPTAQTTRYRSLTTLRSNTPRTLLKRNMP